MNHFVFCHGSGFNIDFWEHLSPYFSQQQCSFIDLGYFHQPIYKPTLSSYKDNLIAIGHSIGLLKLVQMYNFKYLIGINSFINFLGKSKKLYMQRKKELIALKQKFIKTPASTLKFFYTQCGIPEFISRVDPSALDLDLLLSEFEFLTKPYSIPDRPTLILNSNDDLIVPNSITLDNFSALAHVKIDRICAGKHGLGFIKPLEVYTKIMDFLNEQAS